MQTFHQNDGSLFPRKKLKLFSEMNHSKTLFPMRISDGLISTSDFIGLISFSRRTYGRKLLCNLCVTFRPQLPAEVVQSRYSFTHKILFCFRWIIFMGIKTISGFSEVFSGKRVLTAFSKRTPWLFRLFPLENLSSP